MSDPDQGRSESSVSSSSNKDGLPSKEAAILEEALRRASSSSAADLESLQNDLQRATYLHRLDTKERYAGVYPNLLLHRVLTALAENPAPASDKVLLQLIKSEVFQKDVLRIQSLVDALAALHPLPPAAADYWSELSGPESPIAFDVHVACFQSQEPAALDLLSRRLPSSAYDEGDRIAWIRYGVLPRRYDVPLLTWCARMIRADSALEDGTRMALIESLFDYRPEQWFRGDEPPEPPPASTASPEANRLRRSIAQYALDQLSLSGDLRRAVSAAAAR